MKTTFYAILLVISMIACTQTNQQTLPPPALTAWKTNPNADTDTTVSIQTIKNYISTITNKNSNTYIPIKDRIAVFDMDGTIACERPFSMEIYFDSQLAFNMLPTCSTSNDSLEHAITEKFKGYLPGNITSDSIIALTTSYTASIKNTCIPTDNPQSRILCKQFYKPMIELIQYLTYYHFSIYIVSGSSQQFIQGVVKNVNPLSKLNPSHIIGSLQKYKTLIHPDGRGPVFYLDTLNFLSNVSQGKAINIYNRIGKKPVLAFGNTVDDFDMFSITSSNKKYKTLCVLINHDSNKIESKYFPFKFKDKVCKNWNQPAYCDLNWNDNVFNKIIKNEGWKVANMSECFLPDSVFIEN